MSDIKEPMTGTYKAVFVFTIVMTIFVIFMGAATGSKSQLGTLIWGYTAWLMHKRNNSQLVSLYKGLLWFTVFAAVLVIILFASYGDTLGYSGTGFFLLFLLVLGIDYSLLRFFQNQVENQFQPTRVTYTQTSQNDVQTPTSEQIWEMASQELSNNRREGLWAKSFSQSNGDENKARAIYLKSRVSEIENEFNVKQTYGNNIMNFPIIQEGKEWWDSLNFVGKVCVIGLILALIAYFFGLIDG